MAKNLIIYGYSGFNPTQTMAITELAASLEDSAIALLQDAVIGTMKTDGPSPYQILIDQKIPLYCSAEDLEARGFNASGLDPAIKYIHYPEIIDLIANSERVISWL
jgi:sulfur relay protein TusB/DsrH